jgi:NHLM bacteriocin system ABC transporter peptidase/ATP-binding protein
MEVAECGAASLSMVMSYYGKFLPLEDVRIACGVARDGSTARNLMAAARGYGMRGKAFRREPEALKAMTFPLIAHWRFQHFLVVEGFKDGAWFLNDPAIGARTCPESEFDTSFTGVVLALEPGPDFVKEGKRAGVVGRLLKAAGNVKALLIYAGIVALLMLVPTLIGPQFVRLYGDQLSGSVGLAASVAVVGLTVAATLQGALMWLQGSMSVRLATKSSVRLASAMVFRLLRLPASYHAQRGSSTLAQRAFLADQLSVGITAVTVTAMAGILTSFAGGIALLIIDVPSGLAAIIIAVLTAASLRWSMRRSRDEASRVIRESVEVGAVYASSLNQIEPIKASGNEEGIIARGVAAENRLLDAQQQIGVRTLVMTLLPTVLTGGGTVVVAALAAWRVLHGAIPPGTLLAVLTLAAVVTAPLAGVVVALEQAQTLRATLDQIDDVLDSPEDPQFAQVPEGDVPAVLTGDLRLRGVSFGYSHRNPPVIKDLDLHLTPGSRIALVGPSGCGKSTVSRLVTGLYQPWEGEILIDGRHRTEHAVEVLTDQIALVDQDVTIFDGTVRDNVTLWDTTIPEQDVLAAIRDAGLGEHIAARPGGLDAHLSQGGANMSGGQRQRLEIARALVRNPAILVMDEATSSLDPVTEQFIDEQVRRRGISVLVIAHRLSTIRDCDEIIVLKAGHVVERGTHEQLMAADGAYRALVGSA